MLKLHAALELGWCRIRGPSS